MSRRIAKAAALAVLAAGAGWAQELSVNCAPAALPELIGASVTVLCSATNGTPPYTWSLSGQLPNGLGQNTSNGTIGGTLQDPAGSYSFTVIATDSSTPAALTGSQSYSGVTVDPLAVSCALNTGPPEVNVAYSNACTASGGTPPYSWMLTGQTVPAGLTVTPNGNPATISYAAGGSAGAYQYSVAVTDSSAKALTKSQQFTGTIAPAVVIATTSPLPTASVGTQYSQQFGVTAGTGVSPFTWSATGLPAWLTMNADGLLKGTPPSATTVTFSATVTDGAGGTNSGSFSLTASQGLTITTNSPLPAATIGALYLQTFAASGGSGSYTWSISGQPTWLSMNPSSGALSGTPPATALTSSFTVKVTDSSNDSASGQFTLPVNLAITTASPLPAATIGTNYNQTLAAEGGAGGYTWSVATGSGLPSWLTLNGGTLSGTPPPTATNASFSLTVTDSNSTSVSAPFTLPVTVVIATPSPLPAATIGAAYSQTFAAEGGAGGYTWAAAGLPAWLTLSPAGVLAAVTVPATALNASFTVRVTDSAKSTVSGQFTVPVTLVITTTSLPPAIINTPYNQTLAAAGGAGGYTWSATGLPAWATLSAGGVLSGTPTALSSTSITVTVTDSIAESQMAPFTLQVTLPPPTIVTSSPLASGAVGAPYNQTLTASGGTPPYTWSQTAGTLPPGLSLCQVPATTCTISGVPSRAGTYQFRIQLTDSAQITSTPQQFQITIGAGLTITTPTALPNATVGIAYSQTLVAAGGVPPYTWSPAGALPAPLAALSLNSSGMITGTPTAIATGSIPVTVTDNTGATANQTFTLTIVTPPTITTASPLPNGTAGASYSQTLAASGGTTPYTWAVLSGNLPAGLSLSPAGAIAGTPAAPGVSNFTVQLTDATGVTASKAFQLTVITSLTISSSSTLPSGEVSIAYSQTLTATGGAPPYTWSVSAGAPPPGLTLAANGSLTGTAATSGTFTFTVQVSDSSHATASAPFTLVIASALSISTAAMLNGGSLNSSYSVTLAASAGVAPYTWSLTSGQLPAGLALSAAGAITGTPTATGSFQFVAKVTDTVGAAATRQFTIVISAGLIVATAPVLPGATVGVSYSDSLQAAGGTAPYTWINSIGAPPPGLSLSSNGTLAGVPVEAGSYSFTVQVTDSGGHQATAQLSITVAPALSITTSTLPNGTVGGAYSQTLAATGGTPPYTWSLQSGALPGGLALTTGGSITGTISAGGTFSFTVLLTDSNSATATAGLTIVVTGGLSITTAAALPNASINAAYSQTLAAVGGTPPYSWTVTAGALPAGLTLGTSGALTGTPAANGTFQFTVTVTDSTSTTASQQFTLIVGGELMITTTTLPGGQAGASYSQILAAAGGTPPYTFAATAGSLPPGIALNGAILSGTPTKTGSYTFTIQVTDSVSATATQQLTIVVSGLAITTAQLPAAAVGTAYSQALSAAGTAPYTWAVVEGALPEGLTLDKSGTISGTPTAAGSSSLTIQVTDSTKATASVKLTLIVIAASFSGLPATAASDQQSSFTLALGAAYPQAITGQVTLAFVPDASLASPADDPSIQFSTSGRTASFSIPANSTAPVSFALQTGTVAGAITLAVSWQSGGAALPAPAALTQTIQIAPAVPAISTVNASTTSSGFQVVIQGYSNTRELSQAVLQFTAASGQTLQTTSLTVSLASASTTWFGSSTSDPYGSQFILTLPFSVSNGTAGAIASVSVQLVNSQGTSNSASGTL